MRLSLKTALLVGSSLAGVNMYADSRRPNVIFILADDLGYGDISAFNENSKIQTRNIDALARCGVAFTDAHSASALSTPSRYGILTGRYPWRSKLKQGVLNGFSPSMISQDTKTMAQMLSENGYATACIGKWHLGWDWKREPGSENRKDVDYEGEIHDGPTDKGFDYYFGIPASLDMAPYVFVENNKVLTVPDHTLEPDKGLHLLHGGPAGKGFEPEKCLPELFRRAIEYVGGRKGKKEPFFLYMPVTAPHTPVLPAPEYKGKTPVGDYGDFVYMMDDLIGRLVSTLERNGQLDDTIIIFTSDNGCAPYVDVGGLERAGHYPSYIYRGYKSDIYEGGHRIPLVVSWKGHLKERKDSSLVCLTDFYRTFAEMTGATVSDEEAVDSHSILPILEDAGCSSRKDMIYESGDGYLSLRKGQYKLVFYGGSGGWGYPRKKEDLAKLPPLQFFDLDADPHEDRNLVDDPEYSVMVAKMSGTVREYVRNGRSTPGVRVKNDTDTIWKQIRIIFPDQSDLNEQP